MDDSIAPKIKNKKNHRCSRRKGIHKHLINASSSVSSIIPSHYKQKIEDLVLNNKALKQALETSHTTIYHQDKIISNLQKKLISQVPQLVKLKLQAIARLVKQLAELLDETQMLLSSDPVELLNDVKRCINISQILNTSFDDDDDDEDEMQTITLEKETQNQHSECSLLSDSNNCPPKHDGNNNNNPPKLSAENVNEGSPECDCQLDHISKNANKNNSSDGDKSVSSKNNNQNVNKDSPKRKTKSTAVNKVTAKRAPRLRKEIRVNSESSNVSKTEIPVSSESSSLSKKIEDIISKLTSSEGEEEEENISVHSDSSNIELWKPKIRIKLPVKRASHFSSPVLPAQKQAKASNRLTTGESKMKKSEIYNQAESNAENSSVNEISEKQNEDIKPFVEQTATTNKVSKKSLKSKLQSRRPLLKKKSRSKQNLEEIKAEVLADPECDNEVENSNNSNVSKVNKCTADENVLLNISTEKTTGMCNGSDNVVNGDSTLETNFQSASVPLRNIRTPSVEITAQPQVVLMDIFTSSSSFGSADPLISKSKEEYFGRLKKSRTEITSYQSDNDDLDLDVFCDDVLPNTEPEVNEDDNENGKTDAKLAVDEEPSLSLPVAEEWNEVLNIFSETPL